MLALMKNKFESRNVSCPFCGKVDMFQTLLRWLIARTVGEFIIVFSLIFTFSLNWVSHECSAKLLP